MSNTVITNYTDLNGPSTKADSSVVVIVNKDGSLSVDEKALGTLMSNDRSQGAGISVVRIGHDGPPDDATDSETENDDIPHVTLSVDSYYDEPNSIIKYDSGAEMLHSLRIETRENSLLGFQNDHCYTSLTSPSQTTTPRSDNYSGFDEPVIEIKTQQPAKNLSSSKKNILLDEKILPKGKKFTTEGVGIKGNVISKKSLGVKPKPKLLHKVREENVESSTASSSGDSVADHDSDSDYKDAKNKLSPQKLKKTKGKPRILKNIATKVTKIKRDLKTKLTKNIKNVIKKEIKAKAIHRNVQDTKSVACLTIKQNELTEGSPYILSHELKKENRRQSKKDKKTPSHVTALLSDMTSLFTSPDVIRRVSTDIKMAQKSDQDILPDIRKSTDSANEKTHEVHKLHKEKKEKFNPRVYTRQKDKIEKGSKSLEPMPQIDEISLAQILQDTTAMVPTFIKNHPVNAVHMKDTFSTPTNSMNSPGLAGPLSPTLDLLGGLQPEEDGLTEDLLMHVAQLVESSENLQEVIDKQVLGKVDVVPTKAPLQSPFQQSSLDPHNIYSQTGSSKILKVAGPRKDPIEIIRRDGRVITLPPIEAPATRASKRKSQVSSNTESTSEPEDSPVVIVPEPESLPAKQYSNKKLLKKQEMILKTDVSPVPDFKKLPMELEEDSLNSEDDPNRLWCICKQPHNNRFMICCDSCEDWFHGKCVNITKAMGQQMEEQGIEWTCPNCIEKVKPAIKSSKAHLVQKKLLPMLQSRHSNEFKNATAKSGCKVCKKPARASSIYCSDDCILKHAQDSLLAQDSPTKSNISGKPFEKLKADSRVIVFERKTGRCLAGSNAPTAENLKAWLQKNPTFEVVRPGVLAAAKPKFPQKKSPNEPQKIQTTLNFVKVPRKSVPQTPPSQQAKSEIKTPVKEETKILPSVKTLLTPKSETPKPVITTPKSSIESKKPARQSMSRQSITERSPVSPTSTRRKEWDSDKRGKNSETSIRDNVRKSLQEQITLRMAEHPETKFTKEEIKRFVVDTEMELHELFKDVGMKYKVKYRSLMFNIKDRKNLSLWQKICNKTITPKQLVRLSPEELASQELAEWRDNEAKHQLELIKKSELDLLAANKTYVLKTHKGEEVMETKTAVSSDLDPNMPVEDVVTALNDSTATEGGLSSPSSTDVSGDPSRKFSIDSDSSRRRSKPDSTVQSKEKSSKIESSERRSRSTRTSSQMKEKERSTTKLDKKRSSSKERVSKRRSRESSRHRSRSRTKSKSKQYKSRARSRTRAHSHERDLSQEYSSRKNKSKSRSRSKHRSRSRQRRSSRNKNRSHSKQHESSTKGNHRSKSQEHSGNDSENIPKNLEVVERPKSAMKEGHPEYDPHEPMITSAFSDEELRKSRESVYEGCDHNESIAEDIQFKGFSVSEFEVEPSPSFLKSADKSISKLSEGESDQEPSSTVDMSKATIWNGCLNMVDVARFYVAAHVISGIGMDIEEDLSTELDIVGRINPDTVWDYINKMKRAGNKDIIILQLTAANDEEKMQYIALYSYLNSRNRLGVVKVSNTVTVKDFYILPLAASEPLPSVLIPLDGPGLEEPRSHLLIAIVIRQRKKRGAGALPKDIIPTKILREARQLSLSPPTATLGASFTPPTSPHRRASLSTAYTSPALSTSVKDKIAASLACADDQEAYSPGSSTSSDSHSTPPVQPTTDALRSKMDEINRQIEEQKQQIRKMAQADSSVGEGEDEAYSPSRPMTPPSAVPLADISLPSSLQEILATIKQRTETTGSTRDVDMRNFQPPN